MRTDQAFDSSLGVIEATSSFPVRIWHVALDASPPCLVQRMPWLDADERRRAEGFRFPVRRDRFVAMHVALRCILAEALNRSPGCLPLRRSANGKPELHDFSACGAWHFNATDSDDTALIAVTRDRPVGIDIERISTSVGDPRDIARAFSGEEQSALAALPEADRLAAFYRCWVRKEAFLKALGLGIPNGLDRFSVNLEAGDARLLCTAPELGHVDAWSMLDLCADLAEPERFAAALVVPGAMPVVVHQRFDWECTK